MRSSKRGGQTALGSGNSLSQKKLSLKKSIRGLKHKILGGTKHLDLFLLALVHLLMATMGDRSHKNH